MIVAFTGPTSSGKTTLVNALSKKLDCVVIEEVARVVFREKFASYRNLDELKKDSRAYFVNFVLNAKYLY